MDSIGEFSSRGKDCGHHKTCSPTYPVQGLCPENWHLPTLAEWEKLIVTAGDSLIVGKRLKSTTDWIDNKNGTDVYGFSALPAGDKRNITAYTLIGYAKAEVMRQAINQ